jgi:hypothetical protein
VDNFKSIFIQNIEINGACFDKHSKLDLARSLAFHGVYYKGRVFLVCFKFLTIISAANLESLI